jgi:chromate reductase
MTQYKIAVLVGSLRKESFNQQLATALTKMAPTDFTLTPIKIDDLPLYNQDHDSRQADPVTRMKREVKGSHGLLFATPEYNRSIPGVLGIVLGAASQPASLASPSALQAPRWRNSTCATCHRAGPT